MTVHYMSQSSHARCAQAHWHGRRSVKSFIEPQTQNEASHSYPLLSCILRQPSYLAYWLRSAERSRPNSSEIRDHSERVAGKSWTARSVSGHVSGGDGRTVQFRCAVPCYSSIHQRPHQLSYFRNIRKLAWQCGKLLGRKIGQVGMAGEMVQDQARNP